MTPPPTDPLVRMLTLLPWLRARGPVDIAEVAAHFGVSDAQLRTDLATLTFVGPGQAGGELVDISYEDGLITVHDPQGLEFALRLSAAEVSSLIAGLTVLTELPSGTAAGSAAATALAKLEEAAGSAVSDGLVVTHVHADASVEATVQAALTTHVRVHLQYAAAASDEITERLVDPIRLLVVDGRSYLEGWCHRAEGVRLFRLDRVVAAQLSTDPATPPPDAPAVDPDSALVPDGRDVRLHLAAAAEHVTELRACVSHRRLPDGSIDAVVRVANDAWLVRLLLSLGSDAQVVDSPDLVSAVRERAQTALAAYDVGESGS